MQRGVRRRHAGAGTELRSQRWASPCHRLLSREGWLSSALGRERSQELSRRRDSHRVESIMVTSAGWRGSPRSLPVCHHCPLPINVTVARLRGTRRAAELTHRWHRSGGTQYVTACRNTGTTRGGEEKGYSQLKPTGPHKTSIPFIIRSAKPSLPWKIRTNNGDFFPGHEEDLVSLTLAVASAAWSPTALQGGRRSVSAVHRVPIVHHPRSGTRPVRYSPLCACKLKAPALREEGRGSSTLSSHDPPHRLEIIES